MTEQQVWFLLIFSIPFIPAVLVFKIIKPKSGDAKVGGRIPIVKDLQIELGGAIATYVVIVLIALLAFSMIIEDKRLVVKIDPKNSEGQSINFGDVNIEKLTGSSFDLTVSADSGDRFLLTASDFVLSDDLLQFVAKPEIYVRERSKDGRIHFTPGGGRFVSGSNNAVVLSATKNGEYSVGLELEEVFLADWIARADMLWINVERNRVETVQVTVFEDNSKEGIRKLRFGTANVSGLTGINSDAWDGEPDEIKQYLLDVQQAASDIGPQTSTILRRLANDLIDAHHGKKIDSGEWKSTTDQGLQKNTGPNDPLVYFIHAPSKRIELPSAAGGRFILVRETTSAIVSLDPNEINYVPGITYAHATKIGGLFIEVEESLGVTFANAPRISGPGRNESSVPMNRMFQGSNFLSIVESEIPKETSVSVKF